MATATQKAKPVKFKIDTQNKKIIIEIDYAMASLEGGHLSGTNKSWSRGYAQVDPGLPDDVNARIAVNFYSIIRDGMCPNGQTIEEYRAENPNPKRS